LLLLLVAAVADVDFRCLLLASRCLLLLFAPPPISPPPPSVCDCVGHPKEGAAGGGGVARGPGSRQKFALCDGCELRRKSIKVGLVRGAVKRTTV